MPLYMMDVKIRNIDWFWRAKNPKATKYEDGWENILKRTCALCTWTSSGCQCTWCSKSGQRGEHKTPGRWQHSWKRAKCTDISWSAVKAVCSFAGKISGLKGPVSAQLPRKLCNQGLRGPFRWFMLLMYAAKEAGGYWRTTKSWTKPTYGIHINANKVEPQS